jgi:hypothetical protein
MHVIIKNMDKRMLAIYPALDTLGLNDVLASFYVSPKMFSNVLIIIVLLFLCRIV